MRPARAWYHIGSCRMCWFPHRDLQGDGLPTLARGHLVGSRLPIAVCSASQGLLLRPARRTIVARVSGRRAGLVSENGAARRRMLVRDLGPPCPGKQTWGFCMASAGSRRWPDEPDRSLLVPVHAQGTHVCGFSVAREPLPHPRSIAFPAPDRMAAASPTRREQKTQQAAFRRALQEPSINNCYVVRPRRTHAALAHAVAQAPRT